MYPKFCQSYSCIRILNKTTKNPLGSVKATNFRKNRIISMFDAIVDGNDVTNVQIQFFLQAAKLLQNTTRKCICFEDL
jgi:beta-phosphoglucomutase-like phosphatase (HAD superfamily)